jgi:hypothetical protein
MISSIANVNMRCRTVASILILIAFTWAMAKLGEVNNSQNKTGVYEQYVSYATVAGQRLIPEVSHEQNYFIDTGVYTVKQESLISNVVTRGPPS